MQIDDMVLDFLNSNGSITRSQAKQLLGLRKSQFWSAIYRLKQRGIYIFIQRNLNNPTESEYIIGTEEQKIADAQRPKYTYTNNRRLWNVWLHMRQRCYYEKHKSFEHYGKRGVTVCNEWRDDFQSFAEWAYKSGYNEDSEFMECTLDRIDVNGNYEPSNCRWISMKKQCRNRRNNRIIEFAGVKKSLAEWSEITRIPHDTIDKRLKSGWGVEKALSTPVKKRKNNRKGLWTDESEVI